MYPLLYILYIYGPIHGSHIPNGHTQLWITQCSVMSVVGYVGESITRTFNGGTSIIKVYHKVLLLYRKIYLHFMRTDATHLALYRILLNPRARPVL